MSLPRLLVSQQNARERLQAQIDRGYAIKRMPISSFADLDRAQSALRQWSEYNVELLNRLFDSPALAREYSRPTQTTITLERSAPLLGPRVWAFEQSVSAYLSRLESIAQRLELMPVAGDAASPASDIESKKRADPKRDVFVAHGRDEAARESVARLIEKLGLHPVVLHEKASLGRTLIEKLEAYSSDVGFAVVLLTPDDVGASREAPHELKPRARQNVIFELGYFIGKFGRERVCALHRGNVEILSDYYGVLYIPMNDNGGWRLLLARELKQA